MPVVVMDVYPSICPAVPGSTIFCKKRLKIKELTQINDCVFSIEIQRVVYLRRINKIEGGGKSLKFLTRFRNS